MIKPISLQSNPSSNSRWQVFSAAPHRLWFFTGAVILILSMAWWSIHLVGRDVVSPAMMHTSVTPIIAHAYLMLYGAFSFFIFGFLMTVYPRWMQTTAIPRAQYLPSAMLLFSGYLLCLIGFLYAQWLAAFGSVLMLSGWSIALYAFWRVLRSATTIVSHAIVTTLALFAGWIGVAIVVFWLIIENSVSALKLANIGIQLGLWCYLLPIYFAVSHRMLPFFSQVVIVNYKLYRPSWSLPVFTVASVLHFILNSVGAYEWLLLSDIPLLLIALQHSIKWQPQHCLKTSILASLHIGFAWLWIAMGLQVLQDSHFLLSGELFMPLAPVHALTIGFFTTMLVAMVTRVTMGHSGNPLYMDSMTWLIFLSVQLIAVTRIAASFPELNTFFSVSLNSISALLWLLCLVPWVIKVAPIYLKPRADNQPG